MPENGNTNGNLEAASEQHFFRIGQVCRLTDIKSFTLRYWESEFPSLAPVKSSKGQRLYRREDVETVLRIKRLLYDEGFTIAGARRYLRDLDNGAAHEKAVPQIGGEEIAAEDRRSAPAASAEPEHEEEPASQFIGSSAAPHREVSAQQNTDRPPAQPADAANMLSRKLLLDLRDSLRAFLTLLENE